MSGSAASREVDARAFRWDLGGHVIYSHYAYFDVLLERVLESEAWDEVFLPGPSCHLDHEIVREATMSALRQRPSRRRERISAQYEYPQATWSSGPDDVGAWYVNVGELLEIKLRALAAYASQLAPDPEPLSIEGTRRLARLRGMEIGLEAAERFRIVRSFSA